MSAAQVIQMAARVPPPEPETVEMAGVDVSLLIDQTRRILDQIADIREHLAKQDRQLDKHDDHLAEQDRQRQAMWNKLDKVANDVSVLPSIDERLQAIEKHAPGLAWASAFRTGLIWLGAAVATAVFGAGATLAVGWAWAHRHLGGGQ